MTMNKLIFCALPLKPPIGALRKSKNACAAKVRKKIAALAVALLLAAFSGGCFGPDAKSAFLRERKKQGSENPETAAVAASAKNAPGEDSLDAAAFTPEESMRRDLTRLREHEAKQARLLADLHGELSEGRQIIEEEEKRLAEIRDRIARYETAMGGVQQGGNNASSLLALARRRQAAENRGQALRGDPFASENEPAAMTEQDYFAGRRTPANLALSPNHDNQYADNPQADARSGGDAAAERAANFNPNAFAGAPRGRARPSATTAPARQSEPEAGLMPDGEIMVWNPNDPSQPVPPGVLASMPAANNEPAGRGSGEIIVSRPIADNHAGLAAATAAANQRPDRPPVQFDDNPYANYTAEAFSPDLVFGRGS